MKKIILIIIVGFLMGEANSDSLKVDGEKPKIPIGFDLSKGFNIPGIIPKNLNPGTKTFLFPHEIEVIKEAAKNFNPEPVTEDDIVIMETTRGTMKLKLFPNAAPNHCKNFKLLSKIDDGKKIKKKTKILVLEGNARDILSIERTTLNLLQHLSGISTLTSKFSNKINSSKSILLDTRKTTPGLRTLEKYATYIGGAKNHRLNLAERFKG